MADESSEIDYVDYASVSFPSDQLMFGKLRKVHPELFDIDDTTNFFDRSQSETTVADLFYLERLLARQAYESAIGKSESLLKSRFLDREDCLEELTDAYARYGLASGRHQTEQLVRDFEAQAASQASGRSGPR